MNNVVERRWLNNTGRAAKRMGWWKRRWRKAVAVMYMQPGRDVTNNLFYDNGVAGNGRLWVIPFV